MRATTWMLLFGLLIGQFYSDLCRASPVEVDGSGDNQEYLADDYDYNLDDESTDNLSVKEEEPVPPPYFEQSELKMDARPGDDVIITCDVRNFNIANVVVWYKNTTIVANGPTAINNRVEVMPNSALRIRGVDAEDADDYYCTIFPQNVRQHTVLRVGGRLSILCDDRDVTDRTQTFKQGEHHRLVCRTYLPGKTDIKWAFNGQRLQTSEQDAANGVIELDNVDDSDAGVYMCLGDDGTADPPHGIFTVDVQYSPKVSTHRHHVNTQKGDTAEVYCDYRANPIAISFFSKDGKTLSLSEKYSIKNTLHKEHNRTMLYIKNVDASDLGDYQCHVENVIGANEMRVQLSYSPETPQFEDSTIDGNKVTMHWLVRSLQPLSEAMLDYKLTGSYTWSTVSMIQTQRHDKDSGIWKITHQMELTPGLWHARVKTKNTEGWSNFAPDHDIVIKEQADSDDLENVEVPPGTLVRAGFGGGSTGGVRKMTASMLLPALLALLAAGSQGMLRH